MARQPLAWVLRHPKERRQKCSLRGLDEPPGHPNVVVQPFPHEYALGHPLPSLDATALNGRVLLCLGAPELLADDGERGLLLIDGTWRYADKMITALTAWPGLTLIPRQLPKGWQTAYPRYQTQCSDPDAGLASVEALFAAFITLGASTQGLLDHYYWRDPFLTLNTARLSLNAP